MAEEHYSANVAEAAVEDSTIITETIGETAEDMEAVSEAITKEATVEVAMMIMETISTEMIIAMPASS